MNEVQSFTDGLEMAYRVREEKQIEIEQIELDIRRLELFKEEKESELEEYCLLVDEMEKECE